MFLWTSAGVARSAPALQSNRSAIADKPDRGRRRSACLILPGFLSGFRQYEEMAANLSLLGHPEGKYDTSLEPTLHVRETVHALRANGVFGDQLPKEVSQHSALPCPASMQLRAS